MGKNQSQRVTIERFIRRTKEEKNGCWSWQGCKDRQNYGYCSFMGERKAHRASYAYYHGPIPPTLGVLHKCDNPICVNPMHLFCGTAKDNHHDSMRKGRHTKGEKVGRSKLTPPQVIELRRQYANGVPSREIARNFNLSLSGVKGAALGITWKHVREGICVGRKTRFGAAKPPIA